MKKANKNLKKKKKNYYTFSELVHRFELSLEAFLVKKNYNPQFLGVMGHFEKKIIENLL